MRHFSRISLLVLGLLFSGFAPAWSETWTWTGNAGTDGWYDVLLITTPPSPANYINNWGKTGAPPPFPGITADVNLLDFSVVLKDDNATIQTLSLDRSLDIVAGKYLTLSGTILNDGTITVNSTSGGTDTYLQFELSSTLGGSGHLQLNQSGTYAELKTGTSVILTQADTHSICGSGRISAALDNEGLINANSSGKTLELTTNSKKNSGIIRASSGGILSFQATTTAYDNTDGTIEVLNGSRAELNDGVSITGGTLTTAGSGSFRVLSASNPATLDNLTNAGTVEIYNAKTLIFTGSIINTGTILVNSTGSETYLRISGNVTLSGNGAVSLSYNTGTYTNHVQGTGSNRLTNDSNHTIKGAGGLGNNTLEITNRGTIQANQARALEVNPHAELINSGTMNAVNGAQLYLYDGSYTNSSGTISALDTSQVVLFDGVSITGGTLTTAGSGLIRSLSTYSNSTNPATLADLSNSGTIEVPDQKGLRLTGTINNTGTIQVNSTGHATYLRINGNTTLTGNGLLRLSYSMDSVLGTGSNRLTNQSLHNIKGSGALGSDNLALTNYGLIEADQAWSLDIDTKDLPADGQSGFINYGVVRSKGSGSLNIYGTTFSNPGTVEATNGSTLSCLVTPVQLSGTTLTDGTWIARAGSTLSITKGSLITTNSGTVILDGTGSKFDKINNLADNQDTFEVLGGRSFTTAGNLTNSGSLLVSGSGTFSVAGDLTGTGSTAVTDSATLYANRIVQGHIYIGSGAKLVIRASSGEPLAAAENFSAVPEPQTWLLLLIAIFALGASRGIAALKQS